MKFIMSNEMKKSLNIEEKKKLKQLNTSGKMILDMRENSEEKNNLENNAEYHLPSNFFGNKEKQNKDNKLANEAISYIKEHTVAADDDIETEEEIVTFKEFVWLVKNDYIITYSELENNNYNRIKIKYQISKFKKKK